MSQALRDGPCDSERGQCGQHWGPRQSYVDDRAALLAAFERGSMKEGGHDEEAVSSPPSKVCYRWLDAGTGDSLACGPYQLIHCSGPATYYFEYFL